MMKVVEGYNSSKGSKAQLGLEAVALALWGTLAEDCSRWHRLEVGVSSLRKVLAVVVRSYRFPLR